MFLRRQAYFASITVCWKLVAWLSGRASPSHGGGHRFKSCSDHHEWQGRNRVVPAFFFQMRRSWLVSWSSPHASSAMKVCFAKANVTAAIGPVAQRWSRGLIILWFSVRIRAGPPFYNLMTWAFGSGHFYYLSYLWPKWSYLVHKRFQELAALRKKDFDLQIRLSSISSIDRVSDCCANGYRIRASEVNGEEAGGNIQGE